MSMTMALCDDRRAQTWTRSLVLDLQVLQFFTAGLLHLALVAVVFAVGATNLRGRHESEDEERTLTRTNTDSRLQDVVDSYRAVLLFMNVP